ncbi:MAG: glycoside hydrolase family 3 N-terminal domain-containing protein [Candidatus Micrarchaeia archaeon]
MWLFQTVSSKSPISGKTIYASVEQKPREQLFSNSELIPYENFTPEMKRKLSWVENSSKKIFTLFNQINQKYDSKFIKFGPNPYDTSFHFRLGEDGQGAYSSGDIVIEYKTSLDKIPFPKRDLDFINSERLDRGLNIFLRDNLRDTRLFNSFPDNIKKDLEKPYGDVPEKEWVRDLRDYFTPEKIAKLVSNEEILFYNLLNIKSKEILAKNRKIVFVLKHYGGDFESNAISATHDESVVNNISPEDHEKVLQTLKPFIKAPFHQMMGFITYPKVEASLKQQFPEIKSLYPSESFAPASLSPYFVRGELRKTLRFEGLIFSDVLDMSAAMAFSAREYMPKDISSLRYGNYILSVVAGVNISLVQTDDSRPQVFGYYKSHPEFKKIFDDLALETLFLRVKYLGKPDDVWSNALSSVSLSDFRNFDKLPKQQKDIIQQMMDFLNNKDGALGEERAFSRKYFTLTYITYGTTSADNHFKAAIAGKFEKYFPRGNDIWNRGGPLSLFGRMCFLEEKESTSFKAAGFMYDETRYSASAIKQPGWINDTWKIVKFREAYEKEDFNSIEWRSVFAVFDQNLVDGKYNSFLRTDKSPSKK